MKTVKYFVSGWEYVIRKKFLFETMYPVSQLKVRHSMRIRSSRFVVREMKSRVDKFDVNAV